MKGTIDIGILLQLNAQEGWWVGGWTKDMQLEFERLEKICSRAAGRLWPTWVQSIPLSRKGPLSGAGRAYQVPSSH